MDVRCEKCQTEYELDESRLKPGGVTVKCTNCGHMFKIRKRTPTNVGLPAVGSGSGGRPRVSSSQQPVVSQHEAPTVRAPMPRADSMLGDASPSPVADAGSGPTERNWLVRLENGEQKTCRELATLQQWIVAGVATRESLISRSGKTWKRLGDITELSQYFAIADEARNQRAARPTPRPQKVSAAGGTVLPDDEAPTTTRRDRRPTPPPPPPQQTKPPDPRAATELAPTTNPNNSRASTPPPAQAPAPNRQTAAWANAEIKPTESIAAMPQGPRGGNFAAAAAKNEPMFAGRVRIEPGDESSFDTGRVKLDDDDAMIGSQRGSRAGMWIAVLSLLVIAGAAGAVYMFVFNNKEPVAAAPKDAAAVAVAADAGAGSAVVPPVADAGAAVAADPLDAARTELANGVEPRIKGIYDSLADKTDAPSLAMRARLGAGLAESELDRAKLDPDRADADKLRKAGRQLAIEVAAIAQKALKAKSDDPYANLAMADVLRLQGKSAHEVDRYLQAAKAKAGDDKELAKAIAIAAAQTDVRDSFYDDAVKDLGPYTSSDDPHVRIVLALIAFEQGKAADARPLVDQVLATSPDHDLAHALAKRLETVVAKTDPMPTEDHGGHANPPPHPNPGNGGNDGGGDYDALVAKAGKIAETNCPHAIELYQKALEQKPTGVEALTGIGYCYLDAKQFSSAFSKFHTALAVSQRYEPALAGIAETYQQQGNREQAIASWRSYLDAFPGSAKAKKQLDILGADQAPAPAPQNNGGSAQPQPAPSPAPPTATPAPAPAPAPASNDGSASG